MTGVRVLRFGLRATGANNIRYDIPYQGVSHGVIADHPRQEYRSNHLRENCAWTSAARVIRHGGC
jgi:hypothetical protein